MRIFYIFYNLHPCSLTYSQKTPRFTHTYHTSHNHTPSHTPLPLHPYYTLHSTSLHLHRKLCCWLIPCSTAKGISVERRCWHHCHIPFNSSNNSSAVDFICTLRSSWYCFEMIYRYNFLPQLQQQQSWKVKYSSLFLAHHSIPFPSLPQHPFS